MACDNACFTDLTRYEVAPSGGYLSDNNMIQYNGAPGVWAAQRCNNSTKNEYFYSRCDRRLCRHVTHALMRTLWLMSLKRLK